MVSSSALTHGASHPPSGYVKRHIEREAFRLALLATPQTRVRRSRLHAKGDAEDNAEDVDRRLDTAQPIHIGSATRRKRRFLNVVMQEVNSVACFDTRNHGVSVSTSAVADIQKTVGSSDRLRSLLW